MTHQQVFHPLDLLIHLQAHQSDERAMGQTVDEDQLAEILVFRNEHSPWLKSQIHQTLVAGFGSDGQCGENVVSVSNQESGERLR